MDDTLGWGTASRRQVLGLLGALGATSLAAACSAPDAPPDADTPSEFVVGIQFNVPPKGVYNVLNGTANQVLGNYLKSLYLLPGGLYLRGSQEYYYLLADETSVLAEDGTKFTYRLRPGLTWSDESPVTADDVMATWALRWAAKHPVFNYVSGFSKVDDLTVEFTIVQPAPVAEYYLLEEHIVAAAVYGTWADQVASEATSGAEVDDAVEAVLAEVNAFKPETMIVTGPYVIDYATVSAQSMRLVKNPHGHLADTVAFDSILINGSEANEMTLLVLNGTVSFTSYGFPSASITQFEQSEHLRVIEAPGSWGTALTINFAQLPEFNDVRARQALAYAIDRAQNALIVGKGALPVNTMAGLADAEVPKWLTGEDQDKLIDFAHNPDRAAELLTEAGWTQSGRGLWQTPDGKPASYTLMVNSDYPKYVSSAQDLQDQLRGFGIELVVSTQATEAVASDQRDGKYQWSLAGWGTAGNPFPTATFQANMIDNNVGLAPAPGISFPMEQETQVVGRIDLVEAIEASGTGVDEEVLRANTATVALAFNELLPILPLYENVGVNPVNIEMTTGWPAAGEPIYQNSPYSTDCYAVVLLLNGTVKPVGAAG